MLGRRKRESKEDEAMPVSNIESEETDPLAQQKEVAKQIAWRAAQIVEMSGTSAVSRIKVFVDEWVVIVADRMESHVSGSASSYWDITILTASKPTRRGGTLLLEARRVPCRADGDFKGCVVYEFHAGSWIQHVFDLEGTLPDARALDLAKKEQLAAENRAREMAKFEPID